MSRGSEDSHSHMVYHLMHKRRLSPQEKSTFSQNQTNSRFFLNTVKRLLRNTMPLRNILCYQSANTNATENPLPNEKVGTPRLKLSVLLKAHVKARRRPKHWYNLAIKEQN